MRIKKLQLARLVREIVREERSRLLQETIGSHSRKNGREILKEEIGLAKKLHAKPSSYGAGMFVEDSSGEYQSFGRMILDLLGAGDEEFFDSDNGQDPENLETLLTRHAEGVQGGAEKWDSDVFSDYYNVNLVKVVNRYAGLNGLEVEWLGEDDEMPSDIAWREQNTPPEPEYEDDGTNEFEERYS